jgi:hypothetical protein
MSDIFDAEGVVYQKLSGIAAKQQVSVEESS